MTKKNPTVSLGLPVYNGENFIAQAIESILAQTFTDFELVICDNASTDRTPEIVDSYTQQDERIRFYRQEANLGAIKNYRRTLELARGKYFKWIATDDVITVDFLQNCVDVLDEHPDVNLVYAKSAFINDDDEIIYLFDDVMQLDQWPRDPVKRMQQHLKAVIQNGSAANVFIFGLIRTDTLRQIRPLGNYFGCDFVYTADIFLQGNIYEHPQLMSFYRRHEGSSSSYKGTPSAEKQQQFYDPSITGLLKVHIQLRRRYPELFRTVFSSKLNLGQKIQVTLILLQQIIGRVGWRLQYEYDTRFTGLEREIKIKQPEIVGKHWRGVTESRSTIEVASQVPAATYRNSHK